MSKKFLFTSIVVFCTFCQNVFAQTNMDALFDKMRNEDNSTSIHLGQFIMAIASVFTQTFGVREMDIIYLNNCDKAKSEKYIEAARALDCSKFDSLISNKDGDDFNKVLIRTNNGKITEIAIFESGENELSLVRLKGIINPSDIEQAIKRYSNES